MRSIPILSVVVAVASLAVPLSEARSVTREYYVGESAMIVFMSNYYVGDWDVSGNRFNVAPGESTVSVTMSGDAASSVLEVLNGQSQVLSSKTFCSASGSGVVALPAGARFVRVLAGNDHTARALYADALVCGVDLPPAHGYITAEFG